MGIEIARAVTLETLPFPLELVRQLVQELVSCQPVGSRTASTAVHCRFEGGMAFEVPAKRSW